MRKLKNFYIIIRYFSFGYLKTIYDFKNCMNGIYTCCINTSTIDEAPMAYKSASEIIENVKGSVDIINIVKPIYNFKAAE